MNLPEVPSLCCRFYKINVTGLFLVVNVCYLHSKFAQMIAEIFFNSSSTNIFHCKIMLIE